MAKKIIIACDHSGIDFKNRIISYLEKKGEWKVIDCGVHSEESVDYPDIVRVAYEVYQKREANNIILICGTGIGVSIAANKYPKILCALVHDSYTARMARQHNHANCLALGARVSYTESLEEILSAFFTTSPELGRHERRVNKILSI